MFGLPGLQGILIAVAVSALLSGFGVGTVVHKMDKAALVQVKLDWQTAEARALQAAAAKQKSDDVIAQAAAVAEAHHQQIIQTQTLTLIREVPRYVTKSIPCVTVGLLRVLNGAASGLDPADVHDPAGRPDDACAGVEADTLAQSIAENYATARANAEQLNALAQTVRNLNRSPDR